MTPMHIQTVIHTNRKLYESQTFTAEQSEQISQRGGTGAIKFSLLALLVCAEGFKSPEKLGDAVDSSAGNQRLASLQKQLDIENKVGLCVHCSSKRR